MAVVMSSTSIVAGSITTTTDLSPQTLGSFTVTSPAGGSYTWADYDTGLVIPDRDCMYTYPGIYLAYYTSQNGSTTTNYTAVCEMRSGPNGNWHRTRWSGPHVLIVNVTLYNTGPTQMNVTVDVKYKPGRP